MPEPRSGEYTVLIGGEPVGTIQDASGDAHSVEGAFIPGPGLEPYRAVFEAAVGACRRFGASCQLDEATGDGACDFVLWDQYEEACEAIARLGLRLAEVSRPVSQFKVRENWSVQVIFEIARAERTDAAAR
jgi:hypothetical protein